jgi:putative hemolysin
MLELREIPGEDVGFTTVGGFVLAQLHRIPVPGDQFELDGWKFEVMAMDGNRVDKVQITTPSAKD